MSIVLRLLPVALVIVAAPAFADMTVTYIDPQMNATETVEIAANGDIRLEASIPGLPIHPGRYLLRHDGHGYDVRPGPKGPIVIRTEDERIVIAEMVARHAKEFPPIKLPEGMEADAAPMELQKGENVVIRGRLGAAYNVVLKAGARAHEVSDALIVISSDPALKPLIEVSLFQQSLSPSSMAGTAQKIVKGMDDVLKSGAALKLATLELDKVNNDPIPSSRFDLPAEPITLEAARKYMNDQVK